MSDNPEALHNELAALHHSLDTNRADGSWLTPGFDVHSIKRILRGAMSALAQQAATPAPAEPVAHMYPSDLERFQTSETFATAYSVAVGCPDERSVPLYAAPPATPAAQPAEEVVQRLMGLTDRFASACVQRGVAARTGGVTEVAGQNLVTIRAALESALRAALAQAVPAGWRLVPVEPTEEMHAAAVRTIVRCNGNDDFPPRVYRAMLAAASSAPSATQEKPAAPSEGSQG